MVGIRLQDSFIWPNNKIALILVVILVFYFLPLKSFGESADNLHFNVNDIAEMDRRYDWVMDIKVSEVPYLDYPGCKLRPLKKLIVTYRINPRFGEMHGKFIKYEELWFYNGHAIGCRRLHEFDIPVTYQGAIRVTPTPAALNSSDAIGGALVRLILDIGLHNCTLNTIFLPQFSFGDIITGLSRYNYYGSGGGATGTGALSVSVYSNPLNLTDTISFSN